MRVWKWLARAVSVSAILWGTAWATSLPRADLCVAVGLDASGSIASSEMRLQLDGLATALTDPRFLNAVQSGPYSTMAIAVYTWSEVRILARTLVPWTAIADERDARDVADILRETAGLPGSGGTGLSPAVAGGMALLADCPWFANRLVLNVVGDGVTNRGPMSSGERDAAVGRGVIINGLVVGGDPAVLAHFQDYVIGPRGISFVEHAADYDEFSQAMLRKFVTEVAMLGGYRGDSAGLRHAVVR